MPLCDQILQVEPIAEHQRTFTNTLEIDWVAVRVAVRHQRRCLVSDRVGRGATSVPIDVRVLHPCPFGTDWRQYCRRQRKLTHIVLDGVCAPGAMETTDTVWVL
jgi:hypothetical protein